MTIYHEIIADKDRDIIEQDKHLKALVSEVSHAFNVRAMATVRHAVNDTHQVAMTFDNGVPFGIVYVHEEVVFDNKEVVYNFMADFVEKDRGRGEDRHTRSSKKLKQLIKTLKNCWGNEEEYGEMNNAVYHLLPRLVSFSSIQSLVRNAFNHRYGEEIRLDSDTAVALLKQFFNKEIITDESILSKLNKHKANYDKIVELNSKCAERANLFADNPCIFIHNYKNLPAVVGILNYEMKANGDGRNAKIHDGLKLYSKMDDLAKDHPSLVSCLKMHAIKVEQQKDSSTTLDETHEVCQAFNWADVYDPDFDVIKFFGSDNAMGKFGKYKMFLMPYPEAANA